MRVDGGKWRVLFLSIANGVFSSAVLVALDRVHSYYWDLKYQADLDGIERFYQEWGTHMLPFIPRPFPLWWIRASGFNILMFIIAGFIAHQFIARKVRSPFLLWQTVSALVFAQWLLLYLIVEGIESLVKGKNLFAVDSSTPQMNWTIYGYFFFTPLINLIYGAVVQMAAKQYR